MLEKFLVISVFAFLSAALQGIFIGFCGRKNAFLNTYRALYDPFFYILSFLGVTTFGVLFFFKNANDVVTSFSLIKYLTVFLSALGLYVFSLFESKKFFKILVMLFSIGSVYLIVPEALNPFTGFLSWPLAGLIIALIASILALSGAVISALIGVFEIVLSCMSFGVILLFLCGGMPFYTAILAAVWLGGFIALRQISLHQNQILLSPNACVVILFLFSMIFVLTGINEYCGPSMLILSSYPLSETALACFLVYILKREPSALAVHTVYIDVYQKGVALEALHVALLKICIVNVFLSAFQLFSPNPLTLPALAFLIDGWLMSKLCHFDDEPQVLKTPRQAFLDALKDGFNNVKKKDKVK